MGKDLFFGIKKINFPWKMKKIHICRSGNQLWIALTLMQYLTDDHGPTRENFKDVMKIIPYPPDPTCKCRDCRYHRLIYGKK